MQKYCKNIENILQKDDMKNALIGIHSNDELYTPSYAVEPLVKYLPKGLTIWECTDFGESQITRVLKDNGYKVVSTRKKDFDFLKDSPDFEWDMIVTNPPYTLKDEFLERAYSYNKPFAMLLPITALEGAKRGGYLGKKELG